MQTVTEWLNVSLVKSVIISSQCNADTSCHANTIQQGGMKTTVVFNVLDAMYSDQLGEQLAEEMYFKSKQIVKFTNDELIDKINHYTTEVKRMS